MELRVSHIQVGKEPLRSPSPTVELALPLHRPCLLDSGLAAWRRALPLVY